MEWVVFLAIFVIVLVICLIKFLVCNCYIVRRYESDDTESLQESSEVPSSRLRYMRLREPPPDFETALRDSVPISYIEVDEELPPSYEEAFLKSCSSQIDIESSINPCNGPILETFHQNSSTSDA